MIRLTRVELRRLFSRRLTSLVLLGALVLTGMMLFSTYQQAKPPSAQELIGQRAEFTAAHKDWEINGAQQVKDCLQQQADVRAKDPKVDLGCTQLEPKWGVNWGQPVVKFSETVRPALGSASFLLAFAGFLLGGGFVAAEFSSGSMGNWLTFEPRRMRVYGSKLAAVGLALVPVTVVLLGLLTAGVWLIVSHLGSTAGTTAKVWGDLGGTAGRAVALAVAASLAGAAMGVVLRHTAAVIGIAMGYIVLVEGIFGHALEGAQPWFLQLNARGWLDHGTRYFVNSCTNDSHGQPVCAGVEKALTFGHSSAYLGLLVVLVVALAALVFRRRDVS